MSFGSGGFGTFGQNKPAQTGGFGAFGSPATTTPAFGANTANTNAFGANNAVNTGGGMFGGTTGGGGFGANAGGGFGQNTGGAFGAAKPAFGAATTAGGGGLFGSSTATAGNAGGFGSGGGFGATTAATPAFGGGGGGTLFGGNKPAGGFGATAAPAAGTSLFGGTGGGAFGSTNAGGFGAANNPGIGTNVGDPPGTGQVQFTATIEKEANNPAQSNSYQNILFMEPYKKWSAEELRLADYNQGRRHGNATGTGAFGVSSGFGGGFGASTTQQNTGFGATTSAPSGLFGTTQQPQTATAGFGGTQSTAGGFGGGSGLFGQNKPAAGGGIFGGGATTQPAQTGGGGLFGTGGNTGFGSTPTAGGAFGANTGTGTGMFGANATQNKPAGFSFGNTGGTGAFGSTTTPSAFGGNTSTNTGTGLFGSTNQANTGGGAFGNTGQQTAAGGFGTGTAFGAQNQNTGGGLFGNQNKPAGAFGTTPAATGGGGLFGTAGTGSAFGGTNTQQQGGGLFGAKPAAAGTGAFGTGAAGQTGTGTGLFGSLGSNTQTQQPAQQSLFGGLGQSQAQKSSPFANPNQSTGGGLFGGQNQQQPTGLFGNTTQQQPQFAGSTNSMFGASQNSQAPQSLSTSINDISAYGSASLFSNLGNAEPQNPGPLATPLSNKSKVKTRSILPMYKLSPANASRFATPQKRGFGFSYSTYGTPTTPSSVASTPGGLSQSLLAGSIGRGLGKSISTSNLRRSFNVEDSILTPGAFSASSSVRLGSTGGHKKLVINRDMRSDLFSSPNKDKQVQDVMNSSRKLTKRVSFDTSAVPAIENGTQEKESQANDNSPVPAKDLGYLRPSSRSTNGVNGTKSAQAPAPDTPEMEQVKGNELAIVHEEESAPPVIRQPEVGTDKDPGSYWMYPTKDAILDMNRMQRQKVADFTVGRENVGSVRFKVPVDLSSIDLDQLFNNIVILEPRSATVYPVSAKKPPVGKGLNVPAQISLEQSWPRAKDKRTPLQDKNGNRFNKHIERLKRIPDTTFESYDKDTGVWSFSVEHFTTYGLEYDEEDTEAETAGGTSTLSAADTTHTGTNVADATPSPELNPDDTFDFKRGRRALPGAFDGTAFSDDEDMAESDQLQRAQSPESEQPEAHDDVPYHQGVAMTTGGFQARGGSPDISFEEGNPVPGAVEVWRENTETAGEGRFGDQESMEEDQEGFQLSRAVGNDQVPAGIMRARMRAIKKSTAPTHIQVAGGDDWTQVLQESVKTPRRMNRAELRALNESGAAWETEDRGTPAPKPQEVSDAAGFATSLDLMKSLFEKAPAQPAQATATKGFVKWPYQRRSKIAHGEEGSDQTSRRSPPVSWGPRETIITASNNLEAATAGRITVQNSGVEESVNGVNLQTSMDLTNISVVNKVPTAALKTPVTIKSLANNGDLTWELASVLFDDGGVNLWAFWQRLVDGSTTRSIGDALTPEAKAVACLAGHRVADACKHLLEGKNFRLATLVSTIGSDDQTKKDIRAQIQDWQKSNVLADFSEPIRAIYELLAGNTSTCTGVKGVPMENRVSSFVISERFDLDWMQSFGLRLWYGASKNIAEAVSSFQHDIDQDREAEPDSSLWSLLKLYADRQVDYSDYRLDWQLGRALYATGKVSFGQKAAEKLDAATLTFASQLTAAGNWVPAVFVLLHLSNPLGRSKAIRNLIGQNAHLIPTEKNAQEGVFTTLTEKFKIPAKWIWEAKAMHARAVDKDPVAEFSYLILAEDFLEANRTFLKRVAPTAVVQRKYTELFEYAKLLYHIRDRLPNWSSGAAVYLLFPATRNWTGTQLPDWTDELAHGLRALKAATADDDILEVAAIADMAEDLVRVGVEVHRRGGDPKLYKLATALPLTEDRKQKYVKDLVFEGMAQIGVH